MKARKAFTVVEILIVLVIVCIVMSIVFSAQHSQTERSVVGRDAQVVQDLLDGKEVPYPIYANAIGGLMPEDHQYVIAQKLGITLDDVRDLFLNENLVLVLKKPADHSLE